MEILDIETLVTQTLELFCVDVSPNYCIVHNAESQSSTDRTIEEGLK